MNTFRFVLLLTLCWLVGSVACARGQTVDPQVTAIASDPQSPKAMSLYEVLYLIIFVVQTLAIVLGLIGIWWAMRKDISEKDTFIYEETRKAYVHFLEVCRQHPDLDIFEIPFRADSGSPLDRDRRLRQLAFTEVIVLLERVFSAGRRSAFSTHLHLPEWIAYIKAYAVRQEFQDAWKALRAFYEPKFVKFMDQAMRDTVLQRVPDGGGTPASSPQGAIGSN